MKIIIPISTKRKVKINTDIDPESGELIVKLMLPVVCQPSQIADLMAAIRVKGPVTVEISNNQLSLDEELAAQGIPPAPADKKKR